MQAIEMPLIVPFQERGEGTSIMDATQVTRAFGLLGFSSKFSFGGQDRVHYHLQLVYIIEFVNYQDTVQSSQ